MANRMSEEKTNKKSIQDPLDEEQKNSEKKPKPPKPFPFFQLPLELRNRIYKPCLLPKHGCFKLHLSTRGNRHTAVHRDEKGFITSMLRVNKQVHVKSESLLYAQRMYFHKYNVAQTFLAQIGPNNPKLLRHLIQTRDDGVPTNRQLFYTFNTLAQAPYVDVLDVKGYVWCSTCYNKVGEGEKVAKPLCREAMHWFEAIARAKCSPLAGLEVIRIDPEIFRSESYGRMLKGPIVIHGVNKSAYYSLEESQKIRDEQAIQRQQGFETEIQDCCR
jgi:hypothetical protein